MRRKINIYIRYSKRRDIKKKKTNATVCPIYTNINPYGTFFQITEESRKQVRSLLYIRKTPLPTPKKKV